MSEQPTQVLVVDDEEPLRNALSHYFQRRGFRVQTASCGMEAIGRLRKGDVSLVLLDVRMPGMSGADLVPEALDADPDLAILMLSALGDASSAAICMQRGAYDYLTKPIELSDLGAAVDRALRRRDTMIQSRGINTWLKEEVSRKTQELQHEKQRVQQMTIATLEALINVLEEKHDFMSGHSARVAAYSASIAHEMGLADDEVETIRLAGRLHDLGKIGTREAVLFKKGPLTPNEYEHVKQHSIVGAEILAPFTHLGPVAQFVRGHHEHWDGTGYPDGLAGEDIPVGARVICAAEIFDALTSNRPYQEKVEPEGAAERLQALAGTVIDPAVTEAFSSSVSRRQTLMFLAEDLELPPE